MPIRKELRQFYGREWYGITRPRILRRAGGRFSRDGKYLGGAHCEQCGRPDRKQIYVYTDLVLDAARIRRRTFWLNVIDGMWRDQLGNPVPSLRVRSLPRKIKVILQIAHLNHIAGDDRNENLKAFCGWCHLHYDAAKHKTTRCLRKEATRPMKFALPEPQRADYSDELEYCRAMQRWAASDGDGPQRSICIDGWFAEELLIIAEREAAVEGAA